jgi:hypothetical protein
VRAVEKALIFVEELSRGKACDHAPVLHVGDAGDDAPAGREARPHAREQPPRIAKVLDHVAEHPAIRRRERVQLGVAYPIEIGDDDAAAMPRRQICVVALDLDADVLAGRKSGAVFAGERARAAAGLDDPPGVRRNHCQKVAIRVLVRGRLLHVRRRTLARAFSGRRHS